MLTSTLQPLPTKLKSVLEQALKMGASDIHLQSQQYAVVRVQGSVLRVGSSPIENSDIADILLHVLNSQQRVNFQKGINIDTAYDLPERGRFRLNFSCSRGRTVIAIRVVPLRVPSFESLNLPPIMQSIADTRRGLVLVVGTTGSGKSTTLASMIRHIGSRQKCHIVSIEDPIEYVFPQGKGLITQKEVGRDVPDYPSALRSVLRQDPDVIVIGEMRDRETIDTALLAAETGHLVISTLHTLDAPETIHRILSSYPAQQQVQVRQQLASILRAVVALRLVPRANGKGVVPAVEVLINNDRIRDMIAKPDRIHEINTAIEESYESFGMRSFDQSLMELLQRGHISFQTAMANASRPGLFDLRASGINSMGGEKKWSSFEFDPTANSPGNFTSTLTSSFPHADDDLELMAPDLSSRADDRPTRFRMRRTDRIPQRYRSQSRSQRNSPVVPIWLMSCLLGIASGFFLWKLALTPTPVPGVYQRESTPAKVVKTSVVSSKHSRGPAASR